MSMEKGLGYLFQDMPLYTKESFKLFDNIADGSDLVSLNQEELKKLYTLLGLNEKRIVTYCHKCKEKFPFSFTIKKENIALGYINPAFSIKSVDSNRTFNFGTDFVYENEGIFDLTKEPTIEYRTYDFSCTHNADHKYIMLISIEYNNNFVHVRKVGQNPSKISIEGFDFDRFKRLLSEIGGYDDYKKATLSYQYNFSVGAFAYLRRVFERIVYMYLEKINDESLKNKRMDEKIKAISEYLDENVNNNAKMLYNILSKGIHELPDETCKEYYLVMKELIDMQLIHMESERNKEVQAKKLKSAISRIHEEIS